MFFYKTYNIFTKSFHKCSNIIVSYCSYKDGKVEILILKLNFKIEFNCIHMIVNINWLNVVIPYFVIKNLLFRKKKEEERKKKKKILRTNSTSKLYTYGRFRRSRIDQLYKLKNIEK